MNHPQTFAQRHPFYMTADTTQRTIELGRALRAQIQRRRNSVTINIQVDRKSTRLNSSHATLSRMPSSA